MVIRFQHQCLHFLLQLANLRSNACVYGLVDCGKTFANQRIRISEFVGRRPTCGWIEGDMNLLTNENTRLGFIGIGSMGSRIARRLLDDGYRLMAYNRSREAAEGLIKYGATVA